MNPVYVRVALYTLAIAFTSLGLGTFDPEAGTLTLNLNDIAVAVAGGSFFNAVVFAIWGKK